jgi:2-phospho-L-lactate/phosphoenolpyruvate guanylyltransferase
VEPTWGDPYTDGVCAHVARPTVGEDDPRLVMGRQAVLVPVKAFADAKQRLGSALSGPDREALVRRMGEQVLGAAAPLAVAVVCDDPTVAGWARSLGALVIWEPGRGLNGAVEAGVQRLAGMGVEEVTVVHGDLPLATGIGAIPAFSGVTLVPDRSENGTNLIRISTTSGFRFSYGPGSFDRHMAECARLGLDVWVLRTPALRLDIDLPDDLAWA